MKTYRKSALVTIAVISLLVLSISAGHVLYRALYPKHWQNWIELPWELRLKSVELELERVYYNAIQPDPVPSRYQNVNAERLEESVRWGADWIVNMQTDSGRFHYWYHPGTDKISPSHNDNFLRQAGTAYSLLLAAQHTGNYEYLNSGSLSLTYLLKHLKVLKPDKAYFMFNNKAKLGGIALPMLAMLKVRELTGDTRYDKTLLACANMILYLQEKYGTGQFKSTYVYLGDYEMEKTLNWESDIYPGEALLALAEMYRHFKDPRHKAAIDYAVPWYRDQYDWRNHAFLAWTISAMTSMYEQTREQHYADFTLMLSEFLPSQQNMDSSDERYYGSFHGVPAANTASYMEGLGDALLLVKLMEDQERTSRYAEHLKMGYRWLLTLQFSPQEAAQTKRPKLAQGGFRKHFFEPELRIDNTQHAISSFIRGLWYIYEHPPKISSKIPPLKGEVDQAASSEN